MRWIVVAVKTTGEKFVWKRFAAVKPRGHKVWLTLGTERQPWRYEGIHLWLLLDSEGRAVDIRHNQHRSRVVDETAIRKKIVQELRAKYPREPSWMKEVACTILPPVPPTGARPVAELGDVHHVVLFFWWDGENWDCAAGRVQEEGYFRLDGRGVSASHWMEFPS